MPDDSPVTCLSRDLLVQEHLWENNTNKETGRLDTNLSSEFQLTVQKFRSLRVKIVREREKHGVNILCATCISQVSQWAILQLSQTSVSKRGQVPSYLYQNEILLSYNKTHFHKKGFTLNLVLKVREFLEVGDGLYTCK